MLLHVFHKLFSNGLKYYEEQIARPTVAALSHKLYTQYLNLSKTEKNPELKSIYEFLAAYWAVPQIFLAPNQELIELANQNIDYQGNGDISDAQINKLIQQRTQTIAKTLSPEFQTLIPQIIETILAAKSKDLDSFLSVLGGEFIINAQILQDYTQFKPRAHYTDSSLLKTYFMAMKWLMREKFYFGSAELTKAALVMANTIDEKDLKELNQLSEQITNLIGKDDDITLD